MKQRKSLGFVIAGFTLAIIILSGTKKVMAIDSDVLLKQSVNKINFTLLKEFPKEFYVYSMLVDDIDGDGKEEIVYKTSGNDEHGHIYIRSTDWTLKTKCFAGSSDNGQEKLIAADLNNDGKKELVTIAHPRDYSREYLIKIFDCGCHLLKEYPVKAGSTKKLFVQDIDGDGINELVAVTGYVPSNENHVYVIKINQQDIKDRELVELSQSGPLYQKFMETKDDFKRKYSEKCIIGNKTYDLPSGRVFKVDLFGDSKIETIVLAQQPVSYVGSTMIFVFDEDGELLWNYNYPTWINSIAFGDINDDGEKEILVAGHSTDPITVFGKIQQNNNSNGSK